MIRSGTGPAFIGLDQSKMMAIELLHTISNFRTLNQLFLV